MSIKLKLLLSGAVIGLVLVIILMLTLISFNGLREGFQEIVTQSEQGMTNANESDQQVVQSNENLQRLTADMDSLAQEISRSNQNVKILARKIQRISEQMDDLTANSEEMLEQIPESDLLYDLEDMVSTMGDIKEMMRREALISVNSTITQMDDFNDRVELTSKSLQQTSSSLDQVTALSQGVVGAIQGIVTLTNDFEDNISVSSQFITWLIIVAIIAAVSINFGISHLITGRLKQAITRLFDIAEGEGDLTQRLDDKGKDEISQLGRGFNLFAGRIEALIRSISDTTVQVTRNINEVGAIASETIASAKKQQQESDEVVTAIENMTSSVQDIAQSASNTADSAHQAEQQTRAGEKTVANNRDAIQALSSEVANAAKVIQDLKLESDNINNILVSINNVSEQTNLLALNAAIEAARAGEYGRGFAVVADEVRNLAQQARESTDQIKSLTASLQEKALHAVDVMQTGQRNAEDSVSHAIEAGQSLTNISQSITTIAQMSQAIAKATEMQTSVSNEMQDNIKNIDSIADVTAHRAEQIDLSLNELSYQVGRLEGLVGQFKVG